MLPLFIACERIVAPPTSRQLKAGRVRLNPGEVVGAHRTTQREEVIIILEGEVTLFVEGVPERLARGMVRYLPEGLLHDVKNERDTLAEYIFAVSLF